MAGRIPSNLLAALQSAEKTGVFPHQYRFVGVDYSNEIVQRQLDEMRTGLCPRCELSLLCYARRDLRGYWCTNCQGFYLFDLNMLVHCTEFQSVARTDIPADELYKNEPYRKRYNELRGNASLELVCCTRRRCKDLEEYGGFMLCRSAKYLERERK